MYSFVLPAETSSRIETDYVMPFSRSYAASAVFHPVKVSMTSLPQISLCFQGICERVRAASLCVVRGIVLAGNLFRSATFDVVKFYWLLISLPALSNKLLAEKGRPGDGRGEIFYQVAANYHRYTAKVQFH